MPDLRIEREGSVAVLTIDRQYLGAAPGFDTLPGACTLYTVPCSLPFGWAKIRKEVASLRPTAAHNDSDGTVRRDKEVR